MKLDLYQIDAFTNHVFGGNPACVVPLTKWLSDALLFKITKENAVPETAFFIDNGKDIQLRWFTPETEMDLCGHATLATAFVIKKMLKDKREVFEFQTLSGVLKVDVKDDLYTLDFPSRMPEKAQLPEHIKKALNIQPSEVYLSRDYVLLYDSEEDIRNIQIDRTYFDLENMDPGGVVVTAKGQESDFVSRFFTPQAGILEDPVTGSAHCSLIPFWSSRLNMKKMTALQLSERQGQLFCEYREDRVKISGYAQSYSVGVITI